MQISSFVCEIEPHITFTIKFHVSATIIGKWEIKLVDKIDPFYVTQKTLKEIQIGSELVLAMLALLGVAFCFSSNLLKPYLIFCSIKMFHRI